MLSSSFNFPFIALIFFDSTTTNSFYSANFNFSPTLIIPLTPNLHKNEINRRLLYSLTSSCLFSTCTKKLYKSCTTVSRGGTLPLSMQFLSVRRSSIPVCGIILLQILTGFGVFFYSIPNLYQFFTPKNSAGSRTLPY